MPDLAPADELGGCEMVNNPNSVLRAAPSPQITTTATLHVASRDASLPGGGTANPTPGAR